MDSVHEAVDRADPVHRGLAAIAVSLSSSELGLRLLRWSRLPDKGLTARFRAHRGSEGDGAATRRR
jgi:hypothetical protein